MGEGEGSTGEAEGGRGRDRRSTGRRHFKPVVPRPVVDGLARAKRGRGCCCLDAPLPCLCLTRPVSVLLTLSHSPPVSCSPTPPSLRMRVPTTTLGRAGVFRPTPPMRMLSLGELVVIGVVAAVVVVGAVRGVQSQTSVVGSLADMGSTGRARWLAGHGVQVRRTCCRGSPRQ